MRSQKVFFVNRAGEKLGGLLDLPVEEPRAYAIFAHCFTCTKNLKSFGHISEALTEMGVAVLRFDFTGLGDSEGNFSETTLTSNAEDLVSAATFLEENYLAPKVLIGHSLGGAAVLQAAADIESCRAVVTVAAPSEPSHVVKLLNRDAVKRNGGFEITLAGRTYSLKKKFIEDLEQAGMQGKIRDLGRALLVLHSPFDNTVGIENAARIFQTARHPKSFVSLDRADHLLLDTRDSLYVGQLIAVWAQHYLDDDEGTGQEVPKS
jgi:putative redox protein